VAAPLIPYAQIPDVPLGFLHPILVVLAKIPGLSGLANAKPAIHVFGALVALGVYIGSVITMRRARERGYDDKKMNDFIFWVVGIGFVGGHMLDAIFYHPDHLKEDPAYLFALWDGLSSYGGFIGAIIGALLWRQRNRQKILGYCEVVNSAFPVAWVFGRMGCASVHDHPGKISASWLAVKYPFVPTGMGRFDLGLIECVLTIPLAVAFVVLWRRNPKRPLGFYTGIMCMAYAPVRFVLDFMRVEEKEAAVLGGDPRYFGLTPAQWACFGLFAIGVYFYNLSRKGTPDDTPRVDAKPAAAPDEAKASSEADESDDEEEASEEAPTSKEEPAS
jgi:phosphatidylglycerol:prolipoprotein diacylglycerol transferase